jgi:hypothetical protein
MHWTHRFQANDLEIEKPTVVVHVLVERALVSVPPEDIELKYLPTDREIFEASKESILTLDPAAVTPWGDAVCHPAEAGGVEAEFRDWRGLALLPEVPLAGDIVLFADVTTPVRTSLLVFTQQSTAGAYTKKQSIGVQLEAGRNRVYLRIQQPGIGGRLGLRVGAATGKMLVHFVEIRRPGSCDLPSGRARPNTRGSRRRVPRPDGIPSRRGAGRRGRGERRIPAARDGARRAAGGP